LEKLPAAAEARAREEARAAEEVRAAAEARAAAEIRAAEEVRRAEEARAIAMQDAQDVLTGLRGLGVRAEQARLAAEFSKTLQNATLEQKMRAALKLVCPRARVQDFTGTSAGASA
jgi:fused signal recognition particle receptor